MSAKLPEGLVLKSETCQKGETFYMIILKNKFLIPGLYKIASLYKNWDDDSSPLEINSIKYSFKNYSYYIRNEILKFPDETEIEILKGSIDDLPKKTRNKIYRKGRINLTGKADISSKNCRDSYNFEKQNISKINSLESLSRKLSERLYKKALSIIQILPLH